MTKEISIIKARKKQKCLAIQTTIQNNLPGREPTPFFHFNIFSRLSSSIAEYFDFAFLLLLLSPSTPSSCLIFSLIGNLHSASFSKSRNNVYNYLYPVGKITKKSSPKKCVFVNSAPKKNSAILSKNTLLHTAFSEILGNLRRDKFNLLFYRPTDPVFARSEKIIILSNF